MENARRSLGTLGGGNHFIEANRDEDGRLYIVIHSGSRHLGIEVAKFYQEEAYRQLIGLDKRTLQAAREAIITGYKAQGRQREIQAAL